MLSKLNQLLTLRVEIRRKETRIADLEVELPGLKEETQVMVQHQCQLSQELMRRNEAYDKSRAECDRMMNEAATDFESFTHTMLDQLELQVEILNEARRLSSVHMSKVDEHKIELMLQIRHERSMSALIDQLKTNLALDRENAASLYDEFIRNEAWVLNGL